jgi:hypothetical protein
MKVIEFELPGLPRTTNASNVHWRIRHTHAKKWKDLVIIAARSKGLPDEPLKKAKLTLTRFSAREPDFDGLVSSFKHVIDGLIDAAVIADDKQSVIGQPTYNWVYAFRNKGKISVKVEAA